MRLFTINQTHEMLPYDEHDFKVDNFEQDLENMLEKNPQYFFEESNILIIGRQIATNFNTFIDLLVIDKNGNTIIIELKRDKTPRETIAQILEYASFIENLDYGQINNIFRSVFKENRSRYLLFRV
jgi:RecB family endonuclease NucS